MATWTGHTDYVVCILQLADGRVATGSWDKSVKLWDAASGACVATWTGHTDNVRCIVQLADGRVATGSEDKSVKLWG